MSDSAPLRRVVPFWMLQAAEMLAVVALADLSLHVGHGGLLVVAGAAFALLAVTARGPLGIVRICSRRLHLGLVIVVAAAVAVAPAVPAFRPDIEGIIIVAFVAVGLIRLATLTRSDEPRARSGASTPFATVIDATASVVPGSPSPSAPPGPGSATRTPAASPSGRGVPTGAAARWAGRATATAATAAARSAAKHRPAAEAQVKRTIRSAGRLAGRATSKPNEPTPGAG